MLTEEQKRMHRVCFTGHRPEKLKQSESVIVKALETAIKEAIADGKNVFISGMARGVDIWAAEIVLRGQDIRGLEDLETGETFRALRDNPRPVKRFDSAKTEAEPPERVYALPLEPGCYRFLRILRQR